MIYGWDYWSLLILSEGFFMDFFQDPGGGVGVSEPTQRMPWKLQRVMSSIQRVNDFSVGGNLTFAA